MGILEGLILGLIQGVSEFLPISSSGHLVLFGNLILPAGCRMDLFTEVLLHLGTLVAVLIVLAREAFPVFLSPFTAFGIWRRQGRAGLASHAPLRLLGLVLLASIPAALVGLLFEDEIEKLLAHPPLIALLLAVTGLVLLASHWLSARRARPNDKTLPGICDSILIGLGQAFAILPGISRSGMTIASGLVRGLARETAGVFSFLLFIPAIAGATLLQVFKLVKSLTHTPAALPVSFIPAYHLAGFASALVFGLIALTLLLRLLKAGRFHWFGWYCLAAALVWSIALR